MKTQLVILLLLCCSQRYSFSQNMFQKSYGGTNEDFGESIQQTTDGGYIATGYTLSFDQSGLVYLVKSDSAGNLLWTKTFGGTGYDEAQSVSQTSDGGYIIAANTSSFSISQGLYLIRTDSIGDTLWTKAMKGRLNESLECRALLITPDSGYVVAGISGTTLFKSSLIKFDMNGDTLWTRTFSQAETCVFKDVRLTSDGGYIAAGFIRISGDYDFFLLKADANGNLLWSKAHGVPGMDQGYALLQTADSGYVVTGFTEGTGNRDVLLLKTDANGGLLWAKTYGGSDDEEGISIAQTSDEGFIIAGYTKSFGAGSNDAYFIRTNNIGDTLWTKTFGGADFDVAYEVKTTADNGFIATGIAGSIGSGTFDLYAFKTDSAGNSGCNETFVPTVVNTLTLNVTTPAIQGLGGGLIFRVPTQVGSGGIESECSTVSVNALGLQRNFFLSPNPSSGKIKISFEPVIQNGIYEVVDLFGKIVLAGTISGETKKEILLNSISDGMYLVKVFDGERIHIQKLIIKKD